MSDSASPQALTGWTQGQAVAYPPQQVFSIANYEATDKVEHPALRAL